MSETLMDLHAVAARLGCSWQTAYRLVVQEKRIPFTRLTSRSIRVEPADLEAYLQQRREGQAPKTPRVRRESMHSEMFR